MLKPIEESDFMPRWKYDPKFRREVVAVFCKVWDRLKAEYNYKVGKDVATPGFWYLLSILIKFTLLELAKVK